MDLNYLKRLVKIFDESSVNELEIEEETLKLRMVKQQALPIGNIPVQPVIQPTTALQIQSAPVAQSAPVQQDLQSQPLKAEPAADNLIEVRSPIVGTFYRSPSPDAPPYIEVGDRVAVGTVLCIVEAMKLMNEIESDAAGTIAKILVNNAEPIEFNQPLFLVKPD